MEVYILGTQTVYKYKVVQGDTLWGLANEYTKIKASLTNGLAQKEILALNPGMKVLKAGNIINLPFDKSGANTATTKPLSSYEKWQNTVNSGITDTDWDQYDGIIKTTATDFNTRLGKKSKYVEKPMPQLDWKWIKAIIWIESGGPTNSSWRTRPMQIGNPLDPGFGVLKRGEEGSSIIMGATLKTNLVNINTPSVNIKAGVAYLLTRLAKSEFKSIRSDTDKAQYEYIVASGDNLSKIANNNGTTVEELKKSNPTKIIRIQPGDKLKYCKAKIERIIVGWRIISASIIAQKYNVGDRNYSKKLTYVINEVFPKK